MFLAPILAIPKRQSSWSDACWNAILLNLEIVKAELSNARQGEGNTVFDWLIDIIRDHEDNVRLVLA